MPSEARHQHQKGSVADQGWRIFIILAHPENPYQCLQDPALASLRIMALRTQSFEKDPPYSKAALFEACIMGVAPMILILLSAK